VIDSIGAGEHLSISYSVDGSMTVLGRLLQLTFTRTTSPLAAGSTGA
jgi:hypothetical protein